MENLFFEIGLVIIAAAVVAVIGYYLKQPLILAYILAGVLLGPVGFGFIKDPEFIQVVAEIGIMLMLFLVGLEMNVARLKDLGRIALVAGLSQILFTALVSFALIRLFGFTSLQSVYLAIALTFSSTVLAVKLLSEKKDTNSLYGQICIGILIVQDIVAILVLLVLSGFQKGSFDFDYFAFGLILIKSICLGIATVFIAEKLLKPIYNKIATSHELLIIFSLSWCFIIALLSQKSGFSIEIGAFIAGLSLANLPYTFEINAKAKVLRDFFITIFFVALGAGVTFASMGKLILPFIIITIFVLIGTPILMLILLGLLGYDKRTGFLSGLALANVSEFSLIIVALGYKVGHLNQEIVSMITIIAILTIVFSSYMIIYNDELYNFFKKYLNIFELNKKQKKDFQKKHLQDHIILLGCGNMGEQILEQIKFFKKDFIVVDHDNQVIKELIKKDIPCIFGDIEDEDLVEELDLENAETIISTLPNPTDNYFLLDRIKNISIEKRPIVIAMANSGREGMDIFRKGVDYVILKPYLGATHVHHINQELYDLEENMGNVSGVFGKQPVNRISSHLESDHDYAKLLHNLNNLRLKELKDKMKKKRLEIMEEKIESFKK